MFLLHVCFFSYFFLFSYIKYDLKLVASDSLNENYTRIVINIKDVNDLPPIFPRNQYERTLDEEFDTPVQIMKVD